MEKKTYTNDEYNSNSGMLTSVWGPSLWHFLHTMSFNYPVNPSKKEIQKYKTFILNLQNVLPCKYCRINLKKNFKDLCFDDKCFENRYKFSKFVYDLHNHINIMLGKQKYKTYEEVRDNYENFRSRCKKNSKKKGGGNKKENGCTNPLYGKKSKCLIRIVPKNSRQKTFKIDKQCLAYRL